VLIEFFGPFCLHFFSENCLRERFFCKNVPIRVAIAQLFSNLRVDGSLSGCVKPQL